MPNPLAILLFAAVSSFAGSAPSDIPQLDSRIPGASGKEDPYKRVEMRKLVVEQMMNDVGGVVPIDDVLKRRMGKEIARGAVCRMHLRTQAGALKHMWWRNQSDVDKAENDLQRVRALARARARAAREFGDQAGAAESLQGAEADVATKRRSRDEVLLRDSVIKELLVERGWAHRAPMLDVVMPDDYGDDEVVVDCHPPSALP